MLYRFAEYNVLGRDTAHFESFNNTMNMFHDKQIYYSDIEYCMRSHIAVLYWNDNVGIHQYGTLQHQAKLAPEEVKGKRITKHQLSGTGLKFRPGTWIKCTTRWLD